MCWIKWVFWWYLVIWWMILKCWWWWCVLVWCNLLCCLKVLWRWLWVMSMSGDCKKRWRKVLFVGIMILNIRWFGLKVINFWIFLLCWCRDYRMCLMLILRFGSWRLIMCWKLLVCKVSVIIRFWYWCLLVWLLLWRFILVVCCGGCVRWLFNYWLLSVVILIVLLWVIWCVWLWYMVVMRLLLFLLVWRLCSRFCVGW